MASASWRSIPKGAFFDRHPILVPAICFTLFWIPYVVVFFRETIAFGDIGGIYTNATALYWILLIIQLVVCVISHSLTIRTIVRLYAPRWLIWGSIAFFCLSPAWGLLTAADIRHPLFAAVFCVFVSSLTFILYSKSTKPWVWIQLGGGALCVCLLRTEGFWSVLPTLLLLFGYKAFLHLHAHAQNQSYSTEEVFSLKTSNMLARTKHREAYWSDVWAAFLVLAGVLLLAILSNAVGLGLPLGQPSFGTAESDIGGDVPSIAFSVWNLTGTHDVAGIIPFGTLVANSVFKGTAETVALVFYYQQSIPGIDLTFSYLAYGCLFVGFLVGAIVLGIRGVKRDASRHDVRPLIIAAPMIAIFIILIVTPADQSLRYIMPILAAQPMFFGSCLKGIGDFLPPTPQTKQPRDACST